MKQETVDEEITWAVEKAEDIIKNYCCLFEVPPEGKLLWADLAFDLAQSGTGGDALQGSVVASASMGDVSYTFKNGENNTITAGALAENYRYRLDKMRGDFFDDELENTTICTFFIAINFPFTVLFGKKMITVCLGKQ